MLFNIISRIVRGSADETINNIIWCCKTFKLITINAKRNKKIVLADNKFSIFFYVAHYLKVFFKY